MHVVFHIGAHQTDHGMLLRSLLRNGDLLLGQDVAVPGPSRYRRLIGELVNSLRGAAPDEMVQETLYEAVLDIDEPERLVLSSDSFICVPERALENGRLYNRAHKTGWLRALFPDCEVSFALALRNPATLLPSLLSSRRLQGIPYTTFVGRTDPRGLLWSDVVARIAEANFGCPVVVWCNEDTPLVWGEVMRALTGLPEDIALDGEYDMLQQVMTAEGLTALRTQIASDPAMLPSDRRERILDLLELHAAEERLDIEIDLPGWTQETVEEITENYDADVARIGQMPGVTLIAP
jgi:hypothetical protein